MIKGSVSKNFDLGLSFNVMLRRRRHFEKKYQQTQKLPVFYHKIKLGPKQKNMRQASRDKNVFYAYSKFCTCRLNIK